MSVGHFDHSDALLLAPGEKAITVTNICTSTCTAAVSIVKQKKLIFIIDVHY